MLVLQKLLAAPELVNTKLGKIMHGSGKLIMRKSIKAARNHYEPIFKYKQETGWIKDHVKAELEGWEFVKRLYLHPYNKFAGGWTGENDGNCVMLTSMVELAALIQDEDSAYDIPMLLYLKWVHEHWDRFERSAEQAYQIMNFPNFYRDMIELAKPLPLDNGSDIEEDSIDYIAAEKKLMGEKDGMERKS